MALDLFDEPLFAQRKYFVQELTGLDDVFDLLDEWPQHQRDAVYHGITEAMRKAARHTIPISVARDLFRKFLRQSGKLATVEDVPPYLRKTNSGNTKGF